MSFAVWVTTTWRAAGSSTEGAGVGGEAAGPQVGQCVNCTHSLGTSVCGRGGGGESRARGGCKLLTLSGQLLHTHIHH